MSGNNSIGPGLVGVREAAELLGVHSNTVRRWSSRGLLKAYRVGPRGDRRFRQEDLDAFLDSLGQPRANGRSERRVLIVDDVRTTRQRLSDIAEARGFEAVAVEDARGALEEIRTSHYDLVFVDLVARDLSKLEVLRAIEEGNGRTVVAVIVGEGDTAMALEATSIGPVFFVHEPFTTRHIARIIDTVEQVQMRN